MNLPPICGWCLSTPPRHERCSIELVRFVREPGTRLDSVGASVPNGHTKRVACECECRTQEQLW